MSGTWTIGGLVRVAWAAAVAVVLVVGVGPAPDGVPAAGAAPAGGRVAIVAVCRGQVVRSADPDVVAVELRVTIEAVGGFLAGPVTFGVTQAQKSGMHEVGVDAALEAGQRLRFAVWWKQATLSHQFDPAVGVGDGQTDEPGEGGANLDFAGLHAVPAC